MVSDVKICDFLCSIWLCWEKRNILSRFIYLQFWILCSLIKYLNKIAIYQPLGKQIANIKINQQLENSLIWCSHRNKWETEDKWWNLRCLLQEKKRFSCRKIGDFCFVKNSLFSFKYKEAHRKTAVDSRDEHDGRQDCETGDEEADHQTGAAEKRQRESSLGLIVVVVVCVISGDSNDLVCKLKKRD